MGKPRQRAVDIRGLQHQSGRCGSRASGRTSKQAIADCGSIKLYHYRQLQFEISNSFGPKPSLPYWGRGGRDEGIMEDFSHLEPLEKLFLARNLLAMLSNCP